MSEFVTRYAAAAALPKAVGDQLWPTMTVLRPRAGQVVIDLSAEPSDVYLVLRGRVQVALFSVAGREVVLRDLREGALFGELAALDAQARSAAVIALDNCELARFSAATFRAAITASPEGADWMMRRLVAQIRELSERVFELNTLRVPNRLHCELLRLCHAGRHATVGTMISGEINPFPTHGELAARIGTHREAVTRELGFLTEQGVLRQSGRRTATVDLPRLSALVISAGGASAQDRSLWPDTRQS